MCYYIEQYLDDPVFIVRPDENYGGEEITRFNTDLEAILNAAADPVTMILDLTRLRISFEDIQVLTQSSVSLLQHPAVKKYLIVTQSKGLDALAKELEIEGIRVFIFSTLGEALEYARA